MELENKKVKRPSASVGDTIGCFQLQSFEYVKTPKIKKAKKVWTVRCLICGELWNAELATLRNNQMRGCQACRKRKRLEDALSCAMDHIEDDGTPATLALTAGHIRAALNARKNGKRKGVFYIERIHRWWVYIYFRGKTYTLGYFVDEADAIAVRRYAEEKLYGSFLAWYKDRFQDEWNRLGYEE
ncbi:MAG: hypothetical protein LUB63_04345 [Oscillospiraceae bacterium]|nr:hypothetical protein [Oscillospiraceae bacterium]